MVFPCARGYVLSIIRRERGRVCRSLFVYPEDIMPASAAIAVCQPTPCTLPSSRTIGACRALAGMAVAFLALPAFADVTNGSFEQPTVPVGSFQTFGTGSNGISGWTVVGPAVTVIHTAFVDTGIAYVAGEGTQWLDLTGPGVNSPANGVTQTVATTQGQRYRLSFRVGSATNGSTIFASTVDLSINGGARTGFTNSTAPTSTLDWKLFEVEFVATGASTIITFFNGSPSFNNLSALDGISLELACTEPADLDGDCDVDALDLALLLGAWGSLRAPADLDGDGTVGAPDLAILLGAWTN